MRAPARQERTIGDLPVKLRGPAAGDGRTAERNTAVRSQVIVLHQISVALDQDFATLVATRVFKIADLPGKFPA